MASFQIRFHQESLPRKLANSFGLIGTGTIEVNGRIRISGTRRRSFRLFAEAWNLDLAAGQIANVQHSGDTVRFDVLAGADLPRPGFISMRLQDENQAQTLIQALPATRTAAFLQEQHELDNFMKRLEHATPRVFVTPAIIAINMLVFVAMAVSGVHILQPDGRMVVTWGSNFGPYTTGGQWWRLFTSMFLHFGIIHLGMNMWALSYSGRIVERLYGNAHFALLYVVAGLSGSIASLLWNPMVNSAGASGAIFGVFGAQLAFMLNRSNQVPARIMQEQRTSTIIFIFYSLLFGMSHKGIDNAAHLGGLVGGLFMGWLLARPLDADLRASMGFRRLALALTAAVLFLPLLTQPIENTGENFRKEERFLSDIEWLRLEEQRLQTALTSWQEAVAAQQQSTAEFAQRLEQEVAIPWQAIYERFSANPLEEGTRLHTHQRLLLEAIGNRRDAYFLLIEGFRTNDEEKFRQAQTLMEASNALVEKIKAMPPQP